ncbi:MAG: trypsin-like peptidase domain-containing protein [Clostridia bacterium]|nr:trypsin-like peptidase domain-containing protein [Clostridia bacterium]
MKNKLLALILTIIATLTLCSCTVTSGYNPSNSYKFEINIQTADGNETNYNSLTEMLDAVRPSVFEVYVSDSATASAGAGSGVVFGSAVENNVTYYYLMTCHHVIEGADSISLTATNGNEYPAVLIGGDKKTDIAVLMFSPQRSGFSGVTIPVCQIRLNEDANYPLKVGEDVVAIGNPLGILGGTVTKGIVSAINRNVSVADIGVMSLIQTDCATNSGNSGGGLFDVNGKLIGIINSGYSAYQGLNFAVPIDTALEVATALTETFYFNSNLDYNYGYVEGRYYAAATYSPVRSFGDEIAIYYERVSFSSYVDCLVADVKLGSVYDVAGLDVYDRIVGVSFAGKSYSVSDGQTLVSFLNNFELSATQNAVTFTVCKYGSSETTDIVVTFGQYIYGNTYL